MIKKILTLLVLSSSIYTYAQKIAVGSSTSYYLCNNGTVKSWGAGINGNLGHGDLFGRELPQTISGLVNVVDIDGGGTHSLFLKNDSTVWACGYNYYGQFGDGSTRNKYKPVQLSLLSSITAISAGGNFSLFLKKDGTVWGCGDNSWGQLGDGTTAHKLTPVQISGLTGIIAISADYAHSLFLKNDGTVWACGNNNKGQLGDGTNMNKLTPVQINGLSGIVAISTSSGSSYFLKNDGTVWACGNNELGQLGIGSTTNKSIPVKINSLSGITAISSGLVSAIFLKNNGTVWACGYNYNGQLGDGTNMDKLTPVQVSGLSGITSIKSGGLHSLYLKNDGTAWACGYNYDGELGDGTKVNKSTPINLGDPCVIPTPPQVDFSNFPTSLCVGSTIDIDPTIQGSLPNLNITIDNTINVTAPKKIAKNSHAVFVLDGMDKIHCYDLNGSFQRTYNANSAFSNLNTFATDESDNVWIHNDISKRIIRLGPGGANDTSSISSFMLTSAGDPKFTDMKFTDGPIIENLIVVDTSFNTPDLINGIDVTNSNPNSNYTWGLSDSIITKFSPGLHNITSIAFDNKLYAERRMLFADPQHNTLWQRRFQGGNWFGSAKPLVDTATTNGMELDFIDSDTTRSFGGEGGTIITTSSSTKNIIGIVWTNISPEGEANSFLDTSMIGTFSSITTQIPVGIISASNNNMPQFWIADKGLNKLLRVQMVSYRLTPNLPAGLKFNTISGKVEGTPTTIVAPQTYQLIVSNGLGSDTSYFTFGVTPTGPLSNGAGTNSASGSHNDGLTIKYYEPNNCGKLIEIADAIGGTSPGQTQISQTVYPLVSVIANDSLIRRVNSIRAQNQDALTVNIKLLYSYQDIQAFNVTRGSALLSNDTIGGTMQMAVLQMHDKPDGSKEPIIHNPITAMWSNTDHHWVATVPVTKFSEFYGSDMGTLTTFDCSNTGSQTLNLTSSYYVWNYDTLFTSGTYVDTLINKTGCDSIATLNITFSPLGLNEASIGSGYAIYPNPSNGLFNIASSRSIVTPVKVINVLGNVVYTNQVNGNGVVDLSNYENGIYFIVIETADKPIIQRIIKQ